MEKEIKIVIQFEPIFDTTNKSGHTIALIHKYNFGGHFTMEIPYTLPGNPKKNLGILKKFFKQEIPRIPKSRKCSIRSTLLQNLVMVLKNSLKSAKKVLQISTNTVEGQIVMLRPPRARPCHELLIKRSHKMIPF